MKNLEDKLQEACITWFRLQYPDIVIFAIPNGGKRNAIEAAKLKRTGTLAGVADLFIMKWGYYWKDCGNLGTCLATYHGIFIELKVEKNSQTESQREFANKAMSAGYYYHVCRSIDEFMSTINEYLS